MKRGILSSVSRGMIAAGCAVVIGMSLVACSKSNDFNPGNQNVSGFMAFNLSDKNGIGITLSGQNLVSQALGYSVYTGAYLTVPSGVTAVRSYDATGNTTLAEKTDSLIVGKYYTLVVAGAAGTYRNLLVRDNYDNLTASTSKAYIRFVNAIPDSAAPAVTITSGGQTVSTDPSARFGKISEFVAVDSGVVRIAAANGGTIQGDVTVRAKASDVYTVLLKGFPGATDTARQVKLSVITNGNLR